MPLALVQRHADAGVAPATVQLRGNNARVIEDENIAGRKAGGKIGDDTIAHFVRTDDQQAGGIPGTGGAQRNARLGQVEIEI